VGEIVITINSLNRIDEAENPKLEAAKKALDKAKQEYKEAQRDPIDIKYDQDIKNANDAYDKVDKYAKSGFVPRKIRYLLTPNSKVAEAAADRDRAIYLADARKEAAKKGMVSKEDYDETRYQLAKKAAAERATKSTAEEHATTDNNPGILRKIGGAIAEHPMIAAGTVAGIAGLAALRRRKTYQP